MKVPYKAGNPSAGVLNYELIDDGSQTGAIILEFASVGPTGFPEIARKHRYLYNADRPGPEHVAAMRRLALSGDGLTTYVNQHVRENYAARL